MWVGRIRIHRFKNSLHKSGCNALRTAKVLLPAAGGYHSVASRELDQVGFEPVEVGAEYFGLGEVADELAFLLRADEACGLEFLHVV